MADSDVLSRSKGRKGAKLDLCRRELETLRAELDEQEEQTLKQKREINDLRNTNDTLESDVNRLQKQKKRMQNELDQINAIFDTEKSEIADLQAKLKRANKIVAEERRIREQLQEAKSDLIIEKTNLENKMETLEDDKRALDRQVTDGEIARKALRLECENLGDARDNAKSMINNLEKDKRHADILLEEARKTNASFESQLGEVEQNYMTLQGQNQANKEQYARDISRKDDKVEELKRAVDKAERDLKVTLEEEKKKREQMMASRKGLESQITGLQIELDEANRRNDDQQKVIRKYQTQLAQLKDLQMELGEMNELKESLLRELKEMEKKARSAQSEKNSVIANLQQSERAKRAAEDEVVEMQQEVEAQKSLLRQQALDEKRILDDKYNELKMDYDDEKQRADEMDVKARKYQKEAEAASSNYANEKDERKTLELQKAKLLAENKELEEKYSKLDSTLKNKIRETTDVLERRMHQMEVDLEGEVKEREALNKTLRRTEKSLTETTALMTEAQEAEEVYKSQADKLTKKNEQLRRELMQAEEDLKRSQLGKINAENELEEKQDECESLKRELQRARGAAQARSRAVELASDDELED
ncbi:myosin heavy chain, embryonic smooth muscle isoform-like isoform X2 [Clytia hemisphaerica]|uniref:Myosin tail domain-containing protein n=1 Tax=Clytia hemisphaerica TaxID=252671 RepID=A0A7M5X513_9CNID